MRLPLAKHSRTLVVDLSRGGIRLAVAEIAGEAVRFEAISSVDVADGDPGDVDDATLAARLGEVVRANGWRGMRAACLISSAATRTQSFVFPTMPLDELRQAVELRLGETLHFGVEEACWDLRVLSEVNTEGVPEMLTLVSAGRREAVLGAVELLRAAGLRPVGVSVAAESLARLAFQARLAEPGRATLHVDLSEMATTLNLVLDGQLRASREVELSGEELTRALTGRYPTAAGPVTLDRADARALRDAVGIPGDDETEPGPRGIHPDDVLSRVEGFLQRLAAEVRGSIDHAREHLDGIRVEAVVLSGPVARLRNLAHELRRVVDEPIEVVDPVARAAAHWRLAIRDAGDEDTSAYAAILGFALGAERPIDLIPREERVRLVNGDVARKRRVVTPFAVAGALAVALASAPIHSHYEEAHASMEFALGELRERRGTAESHARSLADALAVSGWLDEARGGRVAWEGLLKELSATLPAPVQITELDASRDDDTLDVTLEAVVHPNREPFEVTVTELTVALGASPLFADARILNATAGSFDEQGHLEISLAVRHVAEPAAEDSP